MSLRETLKKAGFEVSPCTLMKPVLDDQRNVVNDTLKKINVILWQLGTEGTLPCMSPGNMRVHRP
jgi:hypothetical protein